MKITINKSLVLILTIFLLSFCTNKESNKPDIESAKDTSILSIINNQLRSSPNNPDLFVKRAEAYKQAGEEKKAIKDILSAISIDSLNPQYYIKLAEYNLILGMSGKSKEALEKCLLIEPDNIDAILKLAEIHILVKQYSESMTLLLQAQKTDPLSAKVYFLKSIIYKENEDPDKAIENLQISLEKEPGQYSANIMLGRLYYQNRDSIALDYFRNAIKISPSNIEGYYNIAMFYQENNKPNKAIDEYNYIINNIDSTYYYAYFNIGYINLEAYRNYPVAISYFTKVIEMNPDYFQAFHNRGLSLELSGNPTLAKKDYKIALEIMPNYNLSIEGLNRIDSMNITKKQ